MLITYLLIFTSTGETIFATQSEIKLLYDFLKNIRFTSLFSGTDPTRLTSGEVRKWGKDKICTLFTIDRA